MKRLIVLSLIMIVSYSIYYDLKAGTLPKAVEVSVPIEDKEASEGVIEETEPEFFAVKVKSGDTVLSLMEQKLDGPLPVSIDQLIEDFKLLNDNQSPQDIQVGKTYKLPLYY